MAFSEVREYQYGDDVRNMDWNVTARLRSPYVKVFEEERELTVVLLVDVSRSGLFGTSGAVRKDVIAEIAAVLSFSASINNDKVGALFFSDRVEKFIPPKKRTHSSSSHHTRDNRIPSFFGRDRHFRCIALSDQCDKEKMHGFPSFGPA